MVYRYYGAFIGVGLGVELNALTIMLTSQQDHHLPLPLKVGNKIVVIVIEIVYVLVDTEIVISSMTKGILLMIKFYKLTII